MVVGPGLLVNNSSCNVRLKAYIITHTHNTAILQWAKVGLVGHVAITSSPNKQLLFNTSQRTAFS